MYGNPKARYNNKFNRNKNYIKYADKRCYTCNQKGHISIHCPEKERKLQINVNNAVRRNPKKAKKSLSELCKQIDEEFVDQSESDSESSESSSSERSSSSEDKKGNTVNEVGFLTKNHSNSEMPDSDVEKGNF